MIRKIEELLFPEVKSDKAALKLLSWSIFYLAAVFTFFMLMIALFLPSVSWQKFIPSLIGGVIGASIVYLYYRFNPKKLHEYRLKHYDERAIQERRKYGALGQQVIFLIFSFVLMISDSLSDFYTLRLWLLGAWVLSAIVVILTTWRIK